MKAFRLFRPAVRTATQSFRLAAGQEAVRQIFRPPVKRSIYTFFTAGSSRRAGTAWQTRFQQARFRAQYQQQQQRGYRQRLFNSERVYTTRMLFNRWAARPTFYYEAGGLAAVCGGWYVYNLETVPVSGRVRFNCISDEKEKQLAADAFQQLRREYSSRILPESSKEHRMCQRVMERLIPHCGLQGQEWEVTVIQDEQKNAFVLPGGKVFVFSGILSTCKNDDGLAAVLGHEIAHNVAHHQAEQTSRMRIFAPLGLIASLASGIDAQLFGVFTTLAIELPGSRRQEEEADYIGLLMMAESCYDPKAALRLWATMEQEDKGQSPPQFLSTHPSNRNRLEKIQGWLAEANDKRETSDCAAMNWHTERFREVAEFPRKVRW